MQRSGSGDWHIPGMEEGNHDCLVLCMLHTYNNEGHETKEGETESGGGGEERGGREREGGSESR